MNIEQELKKILYKDYPYNLKALSDIKECLETDFLQTPLPSNIFIENLYSNNINEEWFQAQYKSISNQILKLANDKSQFNEYYDGILTDNDLIKISQELIFDISHFFHRYVKKECSTIGIISRSNYISSQDFFLNAKFAYFSKKYYPEVTGRNFNISAMPTLIRQAIEIKVKEIIGIIHIEQSNGNFKFIPISKLIEFIMDDNKYFNFPIDIQILRHINTWTNSFTHSGITPFFWQSLEAIDLIENLFSIKQGKAINIEGYKYRKDDFQLSELKDDLDNKFNAVFYLE